MCEASSYLDFFNYKSHRRETFIDLFLKKDIDKQKKEIVSSIIECLHSSATIIDDIQDNEIMRKGKPCYYIRHGYSTASFVALKLWQQSISLISKNYNVLDYIPHLNNLISYQEADTGLIKRADDYSPINWYLNNISKKIGEELIIIFKLCTSNWQDKKESEFFIEFLTTIGQLIQCIDDKTDIIENYSYKENQNNDVCVITYALPVACYLEKNYNSKIEDIIGNKISFDEFDSVITLLRTQSVIDYVNNIIVEIKNSCTLQIKNLDYELQFKAEKILNFITDNYWNNISL